MTSQYGEYALHAGLVRLYAHTRMHTPTRPDTQMHARTRKHAHTGQYVIQLFHSNNGFVNAPQCYCLSCFLTFKIPCSFVTEKQI